MNKGDKFVVEIEFVHVNSSGNVGLFELVGGDDSTGFYISEVQAAAAAYAAKQPAPVAQDWQPQVGERVLATGTLKAFSSSRANICFDIDKPYEETNIPFKAIVGPAPVKPARFKVGDEVIYIPTAERCEIMSQSTGGIGRWEVFALSQDCNIVALGTDLLTLAEARERLERKP